MNTEQQPCATTDNDLTWPKTKPTDKRWAIIIGVNTYTCANGKIPNLNGCHEDVDAIFTLMTDHDCGQFHEDHLIKLKDPGLDDIEDGFENICRKMRSGDELWIYFAGHGYAEEFGEHKCGYLLPSDAVFGDNGLRTRTCISHTFLWENLIRRNLQNRNNITVVIFLDCCCAASMIVPDGNRDVPDCKKHQENFRAAFRDLHPNNDGKEHHGIRHIVFAATSEHGKAREDKAGGIFTQHLVNGLRGEAHDPKGIRPTDYCVNTSDLSTFLSGKMLGQTPYQDYRDPTYPLTIARSKKQKLEREKMLDKVVRTWLKSLFTGERITTREYDFAIEAMTARNRRDDTLCQLLRTFGHRKFAEQDPDGAAVGAIKAFYAFSHRADGDKSENNAAVPPDAKRPPTERPTDAPRTKRHATTPLSATEQDELASVLKKIGPRCQKLDISIRGESEIDPTTATQEEAACYLDRTARLWFRHVCADDLDCRPIFTKDFRAQWCNRAVNGPLSVVENAIYELVLDDEALYRNNR